MINVNSSKRKIVIIGLHNVGKTSIGRMFISLSPNEALDTEPSINVEKYIKETILGVSNIFVTPGQKRFLSALEHKLHEIIVNSDIIIYVIDAADKKRMEKMIRYFQKVLELISSLYGTQSYAPKLLLLAHKQDIPGALGRKEIKRLFIDPYLSRYSFLSEAKVYETTIYDPRVFIEILSKEIFKHSILNFDHYIVKLHRITRAQVTCLSDTEGLLLSSVGNEEIAFDIAVLSAKIFDILIREKTISSSLTPLVIGDLTFINILSNNLNKKTLIVFFNVSRKKHALSLALVNYKLLFYNTLQKVIETTRCIKTIYQNRYKGETNAS